MLSWKDHAEKAEEALKQVDYDVTRLVEGPFALREPRALAVRAMTELAHIALARLLLDGEAK